MRLKVLHVYRQIKRRTIKIRWYLFKFSASLIFGWVLLTNFVLTRNGTGFKRNKTLKLDTVIGIVQNPTIRVLIYFTFL